MPRDRFAPDVSQLGPAGGLCEGVFQPHGSAKFRGQSDPSTHPRRLGSRPLLLNTLSRAGRRRFHNHFSFFLLRHWRAGQCGRARRLRGRRSGARERACSLCSSHSVRAGFQKKKQTNSGSVRHSLRLGILLFWRCREFLALSGRVCIPFSRDPAAWRSPSCSVARMPHVRGLTKVISFLLGGRAPGLRRCLAEEHFLEFRNFGCGVDFSCGCVMIRKVTTVLVLFHWTGAAGNRPPALPIRSPFEKKNSIVWEFWEKVGGGLTAFMGRSASCGVQCLCCLCYTLVLDGSAFGMVRLIPPFEEFCGQWGRTPCSSGLHFAPPRWDGARVQRGRFLRQRRIPRPQSFRFL